MLCLMPSAFAVATLIGWDWMMSKHGDLPVWAILWWVGNPAFVAGTGWFHALLSKRGEIGRRRGFVGVGKFCVLQLLLMPLLGGVLMVMAVKYDLIALE